LIHPTAVLAERGGIVFDIPPAERLAAVRDGEGELLPIHLTGNAALQDAAEIEFQKVEVHLARHLPPEGRDAGPGDSRLQPRFLADGESATLGRVHPVVRDAGLAAPGRAAARGPDQVGRVEGLSQGGLGAHGERCQGNNQEEQGLFHSSEHVRLGRMLVHRFVVGTD
jgi:hypothetical protein